jgi:glycosyltransferase involved in cell wall biosynthesis
MLRRPLMARSQWRRAGAARGSVQSRAWLFQDGCRRKRATIGGSPPFGLQRPLQFMTPISIIIPCYNGAATLARALQSCLIQPEAAQIIVVDDGSTDASADIVAYCGSLDERVGLLRMPVNGGAARARNWGAMHASHSLLAFLDADDEYLPGALAAASTFLVQNPTQVSVRLDVEYADFPADIVSHADFDKHAATLSNTVPSSLIIHRAVYAALGGFPMDDAFRRIGGEDGAFSWALREIFGNRRLDDVKRVRMHYHAGIHAERYFRIALGMRAPDPVDLDDAFRYSRQFLETARAGIEQLRVASVTGEAIAAILPNQAA